jgi:hypothetical protein
MAALIDRTICRAAGTVSKLRSTGARLRTRTSGLCAMDGHEVPRLPVMIGVPPDWVVPPAPEATIKQPRPELPTRPMMQAWPR